MLLKQQNKKNFFRIVIGLVIILIAIQFATVEKTNLPITGKINLLQELKSVFKKNRYDFHSNETAWPWYSNFAHISCLVPKDVVKGRKELNFSD